MSAEPNLDATPPMRGTFSHDLFASVVVFLVALPLCMGIAIASGVPVSAGLITGIVAGLVTGSLAGCPLQVSGPAAGMTVIVYECVQKFGLEMLGLIVIIAGLLQVLAGTFRLGQWFRAVSPAVVKGMLGGIGVLIVGSQFHVMLDDRPKENGLRNLFTIPAAAYKALAEVSLKVGENKTEKLQLTKKLGELHRRQVAVQELALERIPHHNRMLSPDQAIDLTYLITEQTSLTDELTRVAKEIAELNQTRPVVDPQHAEVANEAIEASENSLLALTEGRVEDVLASQSEAIDGIESLQSTLKDHGWAALVGVFTIGILMAWKSVVPKKLALIPAPLIGVVLATLLATLLQLPILYVEVPDAIWDEIHFPTWSVLTDAPWKLMFQSGLLVAMVASAETLLSATAVDLMHQGSRTKYDKELVAQGIGNVTCGLLGALPMTGVIVRSSANVAAGARTRWSAILHGLWLLVFVVGLASLLRLIPTSSLAAVLVFTGYKLVDLKYVRTLRQFGWGEVGIYLVTLGTMVATDLLTGVLVGIFLAAAKLLYTFSHLQMDLQLGSGAAKAVLKMEGAATFIRLPQLAAVLERVPPGAEFHVDFEHLDYIDHACLDLLMNWEKQHQASGGQLVIDWDFLHAMVRTEDRPASAVLSKSA